VVRVPSRSTSSRTVAVHRACVRKPFAGAVSTLTGMRPTNARTARPSNI
jgi:hypothetical protein